MSWLAIARHRPDRDEGRVAEQTILLKSFAGISWPTHRPIAVLASGVIAGEADGTAGSWPGATVAHLRLNGDPLDVGPIAVAHAR